jgi:phosphate:Na+ symporter
MLLEIMVPLLVGLAIFLFGMKVMELAMHFWAGPYLNRILGKFTETPLRGMVTGAGLTALLQSSSAITVITIGMVNTGILTFPRTMGIILGTNIGTCITTELIGLHITHLAVPMLYIASVIWLVSWLVPLKENKELSPVEKGVRALRYVSLAVCGFACILIGMEVMQAIVPALQSRGLFAIFLEYAQKSLLWGVLAGAMLTAVIQSSSAAVAMAMALASLQVVTLDLGIAIIIGANIGTCVTGVIASIGATKAGRFVAWSHVILNVCGAILFFPLIPILQALTESMSDLPATQLAHAQTIFNIVCSVVALPICYLKFFRKHRAS